MENPTARLGIATVALLDGCVPVHYTRSITVHKDAAGNITGTEEYEGITDSHQEGAKVTEVQGPVTFKYLK